ncbi:Protein MRPL-10 [Aphelenchoides avenae]|nr:Protein MRPL-10 [Aphelenchus avenae]
MYRRRLFEAAVAPQMPEGAKTCRDQQEFLDMLRRQREEYSPIEIALANKVRKWIKDEDFRFFALCQLMPVQGRTLWFATNQLRIKGLQLKSYNPRIMTKVFEDSPLRTLDVIFASGSTTVIYGKDISCLKALVEETNKLAWIIPLAVAADDRILSMNHVEELAKLSSLEDLRAQTVHILSQIPAQLTQAIDHQSRDLVTLLSHVASK